MKEIFILPIENDLKLLPDNLKIDGVLVKPYLKKLCEEINLVVDEIEWSVKKMNCDDLLDYLEFLQDKAATLLDRALEIEDSEWGEI